MNTAVVNFTNYEASIKEALDTIGAPDIISKQKQILIKPNLVDRIAFPVTTHPESVSYIVDYIRSCSDTSIIIAEGCACPDYNTYQVFTYLGYDAISREKNVPLLDLNTAELVELSIKGCTVFPHYHIPRIAMESFILSVPVLKRHSLSNVTLALKNMMGFAPPAFYQQGGHWRKSFFHNQMHRAIIEMNLYRTSDLAILDASVGMAEYHLGGAQCSPPVQKIVAGYDPVEVDSAGAGLLGVNWRNIEHISRFNEFKNKFKTNR